MLYTEWSNCIMYIGPSSISVDDHCMFLCVFPLMTVAMVECRLFAYFSLMKERLKVINQSIDFYRHNLNTNSVIESHNAIDGRMLGIRSKIFFINELVGSRKINERVREKTDNGWKSHSVEKLKSMVSGFWGFIKNLLNVRKNKIFVDNFDAAYKNPSTKINYHSRDYVERICSMQIIYTKLYEISDLISKAYGIQIIVIISVQFITLTTILYYCTMKIIRWELDSEMSLS